MNVEIGARLAELRRKNGYSQEELAAKLGLSRQAVSKWERAESSPDTDNLIALASLYGVSLDELLSMDEAQREEAEFAAQNRAEKQAANASEAAGDYAEFSKGKDEYTYVGPKGIHVKDDTEEVHVGWDGIHVTSAKDGTVHLTKDGVDLDGEHMSFEEAHKKYGHKHHKKNWMQLFPYPILVFIVYLLMGFGIIPGGWHPGWIVFLTIPLWYGIASFIPGRASKEQAELK